MPIGGNLPISSLPLLTVQNTKTPPRAAGLSSQDVPTERIRYVQTHAEAPSLSPRNHGRIISLRNVLPHERQHQTSLRASDSRLNARAPAEASRQTPIEASTRQKQTRVVYSEADARHDLEKLTNVQKKLQFAIKFNQARLPEAQLKNMEEIGLSIQSLMTSIAQIASTPQTTMRLRLKTHQLSDRVQSHLIEIGKTCIRQLPPRPAAKKPINSGSPAVAGKKHTAWSERFAEHQQQKQTELPPLKEMQNYFMDRGEGNRPAGNAAGKKDKSTLAGVRISLHELREFLEEDDPRKIPWKDHESTPSGAGEALFSVPEAEETSHDRHSRRP